MRVGADYGRVRVIKLEPNVPADVERWLHLDDNNRLNPDGTGRVVRAWLQLTDDPGSSMILRTAKDDRDGEVRIPLRGARSSWSTPSACGMASTTPARRPATPSSSASNRATPSSAGSTPTATAISPAPDRP